MKNELQILCWAGMMTFFLLPMTLLFAGANIADILNNGTKDYSGIGIFCLNLAVFVRSAYVMWYKKPQQKAV